MFTSTKTKTTTAATTPPPVDGPLTEGIKFDAGKPEYGLVPAYALEEVAKVLTYGAQKYRPNNWRSLSTPHKRYFDAAQRHTWAIARGDVNDPESGLPHAAHAIACLMFLLEYQICAEKDSAKFLQSTDK
jgi:hypothetical protein